MNDNDAIAAKQYKKMTTTPVRATALHSRKHEDHLPVRKAVCDFYNTCRPAAVGILHVE